jgi:hypothetical protein
MVIVTGGRDCPTNSNKHTLQLILYHEYSYIFALNHIITVVSNSTVNELPKMLSDERILLYDPLRLQQFIIIKCVKKIDPLDRLYL